MTNPSMKSLFNIRYCLAVLTKRSAIAGGCKDEKALYRENGLVIAGDGLSLLLELNDHAIDGTCDRRDALAPFGSSVVG